MLGIADKRASFRMVKNVGNFSGVKARVNRNHYETSRETAVNYFENRRAVSEAKRYTVTLLTTECAKISADRERARVEFLVAPDHVAMHNRRTIGILSRGFVQKSETIHSLRL